MQLHESDVQMSVYVCMSVSVSARMQLHESDVQMSVSMYVYLCLLGCSCTRVMFK